MPPEVQEKLSLAPQESGVKYEGSVLMGMATWLSVAEAGKGPGASAACQHFQFGAGDADLQSVYLHDPSRIFIFEAVIHLYSKA